MGIQGLFKSVKTHDRKYVMIRFLHKWAYRAEFPPQMI